ncbi:hypothetical protein FGU65_06910 [Methanoculleus sp. FWC-SCC1]|uniref:HdeD family acid-resistance protein n=1 Tax=Methanoculleus frigidifontis TaxID=2584085 RepID=A0ABT8M9N0_9EURY|nr:DUF308 domain-containing protein [Methanoculleus sp. FWC-SCC1]MDN7024619.1 hypothetical protein [Methanoculleus sp. FWC-SCC1]
MSQNETDSSAPAGTWWLAVLRGVIAVLFGVAALAWPFSVLEILVYFFGFLIIIESAVSLAMGASGEALPTPRWAAVLVGVLGIILGLLALFSPFIMAEAFVFLIAAWALVTGAGEFAAAFTGAGDWTIRVLLVISGILGVIFALFVIFWPLLAELVLVQVLGIYAVAIGIIGVFHGISLRGRTGAAAEQPAA